MDKDRENPNDQPEKAPRETPKRFPKEIPDIPEERPDMSPDLENSNRTEIKRNNTQNSGRHEPMGPGASSNMNVF